MRRSERAIRAVGGNEPRASAPRGAPRRSLRPIDPLELTVDDVSQLAAARYALRTWLRPLTSRDVDDVLLACGEALSNALEHGSPPVDIRLQLAADQPIRLDVHIHDGGPWVDANSEPSGRGYGLGIIRRLMSSVDLAFDHGTTLTMSKLLDAAPRLESPRTG